MKKVHHLQFFTYEAGVLTSLPLSLFSSLWGHRAKSLQGQSCQQALPQFSSGGLNDTAIHIFG